ncbi:mechanosensitive ion channel protein [Achromobacter sp. HZ01]|jgi:small-conductance mechanosensitive channel|uniref:Mechanosensitive ion channel protein n=1 Tax=Achromobacter pulmonis TaxID=1389932 RepID=A0A2N8KH54_9BURK|nr:MULTISPECIES: mechanosensitive ion channel domain-containing protein [Achromobacter]MBO9332803.1 mechanosensitive ion channel [Achromobacter xylosoxidans]PND32785.1 mechanosensitive ion channel protein [Achromobacter pulmonis]RAP63014.1 mechanosensitive ion channel protein [Achromobacter sp. HZ01]
MLCWLSLAWQSAAQAASPLLPQQPAAASTELTPAALADLLENAEARKALVDQLRAQASGAKPAAPAAAEAPAEPGLRERMADGVQRFLTGLAADMGQGVDDMRSLASGRSLRMDGDAASSALLPLALAAAATIIAFLLLRAIAMLVYTRIDRWVAEHGCEAEASRKPGAPLTMRVLSRRAGAIVGAVAIDAAVVLLAAMAGAAAALWSTPGRGTLDPLATVFLQAFVYVEIVKVLVRTVFAVRHPHLRLLPMTDELARYWAAWLQRIVTAAGYGTLLIDPVMSAALSPALGRLASMVIMLAVYVYAVRVIWQNRQPVRERLERRAANAATFMGSRLRILARVWHVLGIGYFTILLVVSQIDPINALPFMAHATAQTLLVIGVGSLLILLLNTMLAKPIRLADDLRRRLPLLEARVNAYVPAALKLLGWIIRIVILLLILDAWHAFDLSRWLASDAGAAAIKVVLNIVIVLLIAALAWTVIASIIEHRLSQREGRGMPSARERTLLALFRNAALIVIVAMTLMVLLSQIGIDVGPLIAGAGVVGLAIGFGAQKLVQDIITGVFIQLENGMNENDVVQVAGVFGTVEKMTIRSVGIRTLDGGYHLVPFSSVDVVANHMRDFSYHLGEYTIAHRESVDDAIEHLRAAFAELMTDTVLGPEILEEMTVAGVTAVNEKGVTIRILIKTTPGMQWAVQRGYNRLLKKHFDAAGIELPYPHTVVYFGQDKRGYAPPANVFMQTERPDEGDNARAAGHTRRRLEPETPGGDAAEVLGNELEARAEPEDDTPRA